MTQHPTPYTTELCTVCNQPWRAHLALAEEVDENGDDVLNLITTDYCIHLLKIANQGPPGPPGPMGPMGMTGRPIDETVHHGFMTKEEFSEWVARREK